VLYFKFIISDKLYVCMLLMLRSVIFFFRFLYEIYFHITKKHKVKI